MDRFETLRKHLTKQMTGLEIGPFFSPVVAKADGWNTLVVDYTDGASLREIARNHAAEAIRSAAHRIEEVDAVWHGEPLDTIFPERNPGWADYVVASHVIEHVPDILGFLQQCSRVLGPQGIISLAVPDMRKCFDLLKSPTSIRDVLVAHRERRTRHSPETLFEARAYAVGREGGGAWVAGDHTRLRFAGGLRDAWKLYQADVEALSQASPSYVDAHAWYFTPAGFELVVLELNTLGLIDFSIHSLEPNPGSEFIVQMRRGSQNLDDEEMAKRRLALALRRYAEFEDEVAATYRPGKGAAALGG